MSDTNNVPAHDLGEGAPSTSTPTFTQDDVDRIVSERLARERAKYADYDDLKSAATEAANVQREYEELSGKTAQVEQQLRVERAARRYGLDDDLLPFLSGQSDEEVEERAKTLATKLTAAPPPTPISPRPDPSQGQGADHALNGDPLLDSLKSKLGIP
ncbi:hypothetical protein CDO52_00215 [Nocardiopsis gilva YIM 90087]|uniref:DUF4355 domain-containing protein n=1 Tax=Nocardiopsis gilva YIM 90087 TaxID=1235441 RepID=A0A223RZU5_9ACTN|nr:hypothetical protein [Nocardiopsis gilva]ASU81412.1 hypothetical protein CDO52_00215 [Nocardiopsis gilva YIM 90087]